MTKHKIDVWEVRVQYWCVEGRAITSRKSFFFKDYDLAYSCWKHHTSGDSRIAADAPERIEVDTWEKK